MAIKGFAQEKSIAGIVFDKNSQDRIARINVVNLNTGKSVYNNLNGVFTIEAETGDRLVFKKQDYYNDTVKIENHLPLAIYLSRTAIQLREVTINDSVLSPKDRLALSKKENSRAYGTLANRDLITTPIMGGAGGSIDALWNMLSGEGKNAANLRDYIDLDYRRDVIDYRFNRALAGRITGLKDKQLTDFMQKYRPGYYFVIKASEVEFISSIKTNLKRYLKNPKAYSLQPLTSSN
ncbi:carboxypeptidase-like regulatory domain-containing protein [Mucilaginibacter puniceus]